MTVPVAKPSRLLLALALAAVAGLALLLAGCGGQAAGPAPASPGVTTPATGKPLVTFVELGSDSCIPCREMRPVMEAVERDYGHDVEVVFYDVYEQRDMAAAYGVRVIPTQVFLDQDSREFYRHEGFLPLEAIEELLAERGVTKQGS